MKQIVFFLEEQSAKVMLEGLLPRILPENVTLRYIVFEGKQDMEKQLERKLRGWCQKDTSFVVLRDKDSEDCVRIKQRLCGICRKAGREDALVRIACQELESWYFGDLAAVGKALHVTNLAAQSNKAKYRIPDAIVNPANELEVISGGKYQKIGGSRAVGQHLCASNNQSHSFNVFIQGILRLV